MRGLTRLIAWLLQSLDRTDNRSKDAFCCRTIGSSAVTLWVHVRDLALVYARNVCPSMLNRMCPCCCRTLVYPPVTIIQSRTHTASQQRELTDLFESGRLDGPSVPSSISAGDSISFPVREPSLLRVFAQTRTPGYEMDLVG